MLEAPPQTVRLADYRPPAFLVPRVDLDVDIRADGTHVRATLAVERNPAAQPGDVLVLDGDELTLLAISLDGRALAPADYEDRKSVV